MNCPQPLTAPEIAFVVGYVCMGLTTVALAVHLALRAWADFLARKG